MAFPVLGLPKFPSDLDYEYSYTEETDSNTIVSRFQSGLTSRLALTSHKLRTFTLNFKVVDTDTMNILEKFYNDIGGTLRPFVFNPAIEKLSGYTQLLVDGTQKTEDFTNGTLRATTQSVPVRFTAPLVRTLYYPQLETTGLILEEVVGEDPKGKYIHFEGLVNSQNAVVPDYQQDFLDMGTKDFMIDFLFRGETIFITTAASYSSLSGKNLTFDINSTTYTTSFTAGAINASTVVSEINDQQGSSVEAQVFNTDQIKIRTVTDRGYFTISDTAFAHLGLAAPVIYPIHKHDGSVGYYFKQDGTGDLTFFIDDGTVNKTITANTSFHLLDGNWNLISVICDRSGNGQLYVNGDTSGAAVDVSSAGLTLINSGDFYLHKDANLSVDMDRIGVWSWDASSLPTDISSRIETMSSNWFRIDDEDGLQTLYAFDNSTGNDYKQQENSTLNNNPVFIDFAVQT